MREPARHHGLHIRVGRPLAQPAARLPGQQDQHRQELEHCGGRAEQGPAAAEEGRLAAQAEHSGRPGLDARLRLAAEEVRVRWLDESRSAFGAEGLAGLG